jgi:uncharacterized phiE125 gp8 family phage protein
MATGDLCAPADVQAFLSLTAGQDNALLATLCTNASAAVLNFTNRSLLTASHTETRNGQGGDRMPLYEWPVTAVASVSINGTAIPLSTSINQPGYVFDDKTVYLRGYRFTRDVQNVVIAYTAGYADVPVDVNQAVTEIVAVKYKRRTNIEVSAKTLNGETISFTQADMPASAKTVLSNYRRIYMV